MAIKKKLKTKVKAEKTTKVAVPTPDTGPQESSTYSGYCVKCKAKDTKYEGKVEVSKTGMNMAKGPCPTCGTTICRILGKAAA